ncbi:hypothetical protein PMIT1320_00002 [Prochlorococcus marinus str. MIT 1320]|nr:hypothetical protein PMIT1320_00002 [Prochlorococcus marinus str. MIT 1320]
MEKTAKSGLEGQVSRVVRVVSTLLLVDQWWKVRPLVFVREVLSKSPFA